MPPNPRSEASNGIAFLAERDYSPAMPTVTIKMTEVQFAALAREARARGTSKAGILRDAFLKKQEQTSSDSAYNLISDLVGSVKGPPDLATNPKYLQDYGRPRAPRRK